MIEKRARARKAQAGKARAAYPGKALRFGPALMARLDALAAFTEVPGQLTRRYLTPAHVAAMGQVRAWMEEAGMQARVDAVCNVIGRYEGKRPGAPAILLCQASHRPLHNLRSDHDRKAGKGRQGSGCQGSSWGYR